MSALPIDNAPEPGVACAAGPPSAMNARALFESSLGVIDEVVARVCRRGRLSGADAEDFDSLVKLALLENDCEVLRRHTGVSSLGAYLSVVIARMLSDERIRSMGRFYASAEATRIGPAAVLLETLVVRDRRPLDEVLPIVRASYPEITRPEAERILVGLPARAPRPRFIDIDQPGAPLAAPESPDPVVVAQLSARTASVLRETLASLPLEDRTLMRLHFGESISIADASRMMRVPQRPLYRRLERVLALFRAALERQGIDARSMPELLSGVFGGQLDFGLRGSEPALRAVGEGS
jgi:DNA-directed RNA polymerase specialized sigma24 family protein